MNNHQAIDKTINFIREKFEGEGSGHDWWHIYRVWSNSLTIGREEKADMYIVQLGALLHDIADFKFHKGDFTVGPKAAREYLESLGVNKETIDHVCDIVENISFKGTGEEKPMKTIEGKVVRDADRLDAIGAIGIARCFAYGGHKDRMIYNPEGKVKTHASVIDYLKGTDSSIHHVHEKLLLLKNLMLTETGKKMAEDRHLFMERYLEQFHKEWAGLC